MFRDWIKKLYASYSKTFLTCLNYVSCTLYKFRINKLSFLDDKNNKKLKRIRFIISLIKERIIRLSLLYQLPHSRWLFVLQVRPISRHLLNKMSSVYSPPPGYVAPENIKCKKTKYGLFLLPANIVKFYTYFILIFPFLCFLPIIASSPQNFTLLFFVFFLVGLLTVRGIVYRYMPVVLQDICKKWPISSYHLFLSVPHDVYMKCCDIDNDKNLFWHPDGFTKTKRQPAEFSYKNNTLQEVMLSMAIFEVLFKKREGVVNHKESFSFTGMDTNIKTKNWFNIIISPVIISYLLIFISLFVYFLLSVDPAQYDGCRSGELLSYPTNFLFIGFLWIFSVFTYAAWMQSKLIKMHDLIRNGYYSSQLEQVPQSLLDDLFMRIPESGVIDQAIKSMSSMMQVAGSIMFLGFLSAIEVLSQIVCK